MQKTSKQHVFVKFVKDEDVVQHILHIEDKKPGKPQKTTTCSLSYSTGIGSTHKRKKMLVNSDVVDDSSSDLEENLTGLTALTVQDEDIAGKQVFSFRTPKKSGQMALKVSESKGIVTPTTTLSEKKRKKLCNSDSGSPVSTHERSRRLRNAERLPCTTTPYRLRKRHAIEDSSDEDSVGEDNNDEEEEDEGEEMEVNCRKSLERKSISVDLTSNVEEYFKVHAAAGVTSDRTLSRLDLLQMDIEMLREILTKSVKTHGTQCKVLYSKHQQLFQQWMFSMCNNFSILLYGLGSKRDLLEEFRKQYLTQFSHLVVNGYFPSLSIKQILTSITEDILEHKGNFRSPLDQVEFIKGYFESQEQEDFFLLLHNIDGAMLRGEKTQNILSMLAQISGFHILASVDQINAPLIWDQTKCSRFRWVWQDVTTYAQYTSETSYESSFLVQQSSGMALRSLEHVMRSLTPNARKIFELLAQYQLDNADNSSYIGMSFQDLYLRSRESFLVNSDQTLRVQLVEFRDHKLIRTRKNYDGVEHLIIPLESSALKEFLSLEQGSNL